MNKQQLIEAVVIASGLTKANATKAINAVINTIEDTIAAGDSVSLIGHFSIKPSKRAAREGVNPSTGAKIQIAESNGAKFKLGKGFKAKLNK